MTQPLGGCEELPDDWITTASVIRETSREVICCLGRMKDDKESWWSNKEVQQNIQRGILVRKKRESKRSAGNRQEYKEMQHMEKREMTKTKQKSYNELYVRLDIKEGEKNPYQLTREWDQASRWR